MAIKFKTKDGLSDTFVPKATDEIPPEFPPESIAPAEYTILNALEELATKGKTLMLVSKTTGEGYQCLAYDPLTGKAKLKGNHGQLLNPKIGIREAGLYSAVWRG